MRVLVTGGAGMLGRAVVRQLQGEHKVFYTWRNQPADIPGATAIQCDLAHNGLQLPAVDAVVHTSALTDVDYCQQHPDQAQRDNVTATRNIWRACTGAYPIYISTDFVFDGSKGNYREEDSANPISEYGKTKYLGEQEIPRQGCIIRTSIYGLLQSKQRLTFVEKALARFGNGETVTAFADQWFSPMAVDNLAQVVSELIDSRHAGIMHVGGTERLSKHEFFARLAKSFGFDESLVIKNSFAGHAFIAPRPRDASLDSSRARTLLATRFWGLEESFEQIKQSLHQQGH